MMKKLSLTLCAALLFAAGALTAYVHAQKKAVTESHAECPLMKDGGHDAHHAAVNKRGEEAMGFSQTETAHHFLLTRDGGVILVEVKDPADASNRERIRQHLAHITQLFAAGAFNTPMLVHARTVPGTSVMSRLKSEITYAFEETERGGRVRINTKNPEALAAVQEFLRFQIKDHQTGDEQ